MIVMFVGSGSAALPGSGSANMYSRPERACELECELSSVNSAGQDDQRNGVPMGFVSLNKFQGPEAITKGRILSKQTGP